MFVIFKFSHGDTLKKQKACFRHTIGCISDTRSQKIEHILKFEIIIIIKDSKKANKIVFSCGIYYQSYISAM